MADDHVNVSDCAASGYLLCQDVTAAKVVRHKTQNDPNLTQNRRRSLNVQKRKMNVCTNESHNVTSKTQNPSEDAEDGHRPKNSQTETTKRKTHMCSHNDTKDGNKTIQIIKNRKTLEKKTFRVGSTRRHYVGAGAQRQMN